MKKRQKGVSPEPNQNINYEARQKDRLKVEPLVKTFKKKQQLYDYSPSMKTPSHPNNSFNKIRQEKKSTERHPQSGRIVSGRSVSKTKAQQPVERVNLNEAIYKEGQLSATSKLSHILQIFRIDDRGDVRQTLQNLYDANDNYIDLLYLWQKGEQYDQIDRLVYLLIEQFIKILEGVLQRSIKGMTDQLHYYETRIIELIEENKRLSNQKIFMRRNSYLDQQIEQRLMDYYQQNQWSTMIFYSFQKNQFDLENYVRKLRQLEGTPQEYLSKAMGRDLHPLYQHQSQGGYNQREVGNHHLSTNANRQQSLKIKIPSTKSLCID